MTRLLRLAAAFWLLASGAAALAFPDLYVMRHLEHRGEGSHARLSEIGANSARRLAIGFPLPPPAAIYTATEQVSLDSAAWLAVELGVTPTLFDPAKPEALMARLATESGPVLVVASKDTAAALVARASGAAAPAIAEGTFGEIWAIAARDRAVTRRVLAGPRVAADQRSTSTKDWLDEGEVAERQSAK